MRQVTLAKRFQCHVYNVSILNIIFCQIFVKQIQLRGRLTTPDAVNHLYQIYIFILYQLVQVLGAINKVSHSTPPESFDSSIPKSLKKTRVSNL